ncbi:MAG: response regulator [Lentisphaerae bacterium]|nr:response regulator [Lentisphaerota bacterium]
MFKKATTFGAAQIVRTILVVDDDPEWLDFLVRALGAEYPVLSATNGEDAVRRAQRARPDAIVLDVMMPGGKDGFATYAELQRDPATRDIPVLMLSDVNRKLGLAFDAEELNRHLGKAPAGFLEKPISADRLLNEVKKVLHMGHPIVMTAV